MIGNFNQRDPYCDNSMQAYAANQAAYLRPLRCDPQACDALSAALARPQNAVTEGGHIDLRQIIDVLADADAILAWMKTNQEPPK